MTRRTLLYLTLLLLPLTAAAQDLNKLWIPDVTATPGEQVTLPVYVRNTCNDLVGAQFELTLPNGVTLDANGGEISDRCTDHEVLISKNGNAWRVMLYSPSSSSIAGNAGIVVNLHGHVGSNFQSDQHYRILLNRVILSDSKGNDVATEHSCGDLIIGPSADFIIRNVTASTTTLTPGEPFTASWVVTNQGHAPSHSGWKEDIYLLDSNNGRTTLTTIYCSDSLATNASINHSAEITLPVLLGLEGNVRLQVKLTPNLDSGEAVEYQGNNTTTGEQTLTLAKCLSLEVPERIDEGNRTLRCRLARSGSWQQAETFNLSVTGDGRLSVPSTVTIPAGQSGAWFNLTVTDDSTLNTDSLFTLSASGTLTPGGTGYATQRKQIVVLDNEQPTLTLTASPSEVSEGETITFTVKAQRAPQQDLPLRLSCDVAKRFDIPTGLTLPKGSKNVSFAVTAIDDELPSTTISPTFTISAVGYASGQAITILHDNDVPAISLTLTPTTMAETAGPIAMMAVLRRTSNIDKNITVKLTDDSPQHEIDYGQFSSISMPKGVEEVKFSIGVKDNLEVDGDRDVTITASVYIQSCSCSASSDDGGVVSQTIHILDNDGPSLTLTSSRSLLLEGAEEATVLTVTRNTTTSKALTVSITSTYDEGLQYSHSVTIPKGQKSVSVTVKALSNQTENDNTTVTFTASATGHSDGTCWVTVSDQTLPDAVISKMELLTADGNAVGTDGVTASSFLQARITVGNIGAIALPAGLNVNLYQSAGTSRAAILKTDAPIAPGATAVLTYTLRTPNAVGNYSAWAKVNEDESVRELLYANNTSATATVAVCSPFGATVSVDKNVLQYGDSVTVSGHITKLDGSTWSDDGGTQVVLYFIIEGQRYTQTVLANQNGNFTFTWKPMQSHMGHVAIGACFPGETTREEMAGVDIYGMRRVSGRYDSFETLIDQPHRGTVTVQNPGRLPLTGLTVAVTDNADDATIVIDAPQSIGGGETVSIGYTLTGRKTGGNNDWQVAKLNISTAEGPEVPYTIYYYTRNPEAQLSSSASRINMTVTKGSSRDFSFKIANIGMGNSGTVSLALPQWIESLTPLRMASMAPKDTTEVVIRITPTDEMQLNVPVTGHIGINCESGQGLAIPFTIEPVSESTGELVVDVCDEYTYYTAEAPHVSGATVTVQHPVTGAVIKQGITDAKGIFDTTLPEGYYKLLVTHPKHHSYQATILLDPGKKTTKVVNLGTDAIEVSWEVVETTVEDSYEIVTTVNYETNVPVPVVKVNMPAYVPAKKLKEGESLVYHATLTNEGLIMAKGVHLDMPTGFKALKFEALDHEEPFELAAHQSVVIPIKVTHIAAENTPQAIRGARRETHTPLDDDDCYAMHPIAYYYECGTDSMYHKYWNGIRLGECEKEEADGHAENNSSTSGDDGIFGWGWDETNNGGPYRPNYPKPLFGDEVHIKPVSTDGEPYKCNPCGNQVLLNLMKLNPVLAAVAEAAEEAKNIYNCAYDIQHKDNWHDKLADCKYTERAVKKYDSYANAVKNLYDDFGAMYDIGADIYGHIKDREIFTRDMLEDCKSFYDTMYDAYDDIGTLAGKTQAIVDDLTPMAERISNSIEQGKQMEREWNEWNSRTVFNNDDQIRDLQLDMLESGETQARYDQRYNERMEAIYNYNEQELATDENYSNIVESAMDLAMGKELTRADKQKLGQDIVKAGMDALYNAHDFKEMAKTQGKNQQEILKSAYLDTENKILDKLPAVIDLLDSTFGDCEYEGPPQSGEGGSGEGFEPGGGGGGDGTGSHAPTRRRISMNGSSVSIPYAYLEFKQQLFHAICMVEIERDMSLEYFGDSIWLGLTHIEYAPVAWAIEQVKRHGEAAIDNPNIAIYRPNGISEEQLRTFLRRWYNTYGPSGAAHSPARRARSNDANVVNLERMEQLRLSLLEEADSIMEGKTGTIEDVITRTYQTAYDEVTGRSNAVCASITLQFTQSMTLTRQAFRGTLKVHNGNDEKPMTDIVLQLEVRNATDGTLATSREIHIEPESLNGFDGPLNLTDGWTLAPNGDGTATILFIPSKYAAPTEPQDYTFGGRLTYLDPFNNLVVTRELAPVTLTVKPSPELDLLYFMQKDVYGDDPLTTYVVEPSKDAEFALVIHNKGYGEATNVRMETQQPKIVDNEKGLLADFEMMSSQLNGGDANLALGESVHTDFGNIAPGTTAYAQWWFRCSLLGHFTKYNVEATHVTSYGNPDLSLLDEVSIHELIHGFTADGMRGFLVNDILDNADLPDEVYFSDATQQDVGIASNLTITKQSNREFILTVTTDQPGWTYGKMPDPANGWQDIVSIVRQRDGKVIPLDNVWLTDKTLRNGHEPLYETLLHFVGEVANGSETYLLTFEERPDTILEVSSFGGLPEDGSLAPAPVTEVRVVFNKTIRPETFTSADLMLTCQGRKIDASAATVRKVSEKEYAVNLTGLTAADGYYVLTVMTEDITDGEGFKGRNGYAAKWTQLNSGTVTLRLDIEPEGRGTVTYQTLNTSGTPVGEPVTFSEAGSQNILLGHIARLTARPTEGYAFSHWTRGGETVSTDSVYQFAVAWNDNVVAHYKPIKYKVTIVNRVLQGRVIGAATGIYDYGTELKLDVQPYGTNRFIKWIINDTEEVTTRELTITVDNELKLETVYALLGDVNYDLSLSISDVMMMVGHVTGMRLLKNTNNADMNGDHSISISDVQLLVRAVLLGK